MGGQNRPSLKRCVDLKFKFTWFQYLKRNAFYISIIRRHAWLWRYTFFGKRQRHIEVNWSILWHEKLKQLYFGSFGAFLPKEVGQTKFFIIWSIFCSKDLYTTDFECKFSFQKASSSLIMGLLLNCNLKATLQQMFSKISAKRFHRFSLTSIWFWHLLNGFLFPLSGWQSP